MDEETHNKKWKITHRKIQEIVFHLLKEHPIKEISVSQVCKKANINRSTFYDHFEDIYELFDVTQLNKRKELFASFIKQSNPQEKFNFYDLQSLTHFLTFIKENGWIYSIVLKSRQDFPITEGFEELYKVLIDPLKKKRPELTDNELAYYFIAFQSSFTFILKRWSDNDYREKEKEIAAILINSMPLILKNKQR
ncbi:TetR family transcriptional regulator [Oenococcus oeni]|uniref:TetR/AcrR family transcriptional regulator n=1 Tax=Oenococcus oeni TaxID=1247 RepID=UPI0010BBF482|nr:TetR/AcrR family transcriptional regulator [Oenococcus oeni]SYV99008.1 TetR family transcriptional regulator [Oenococcus oeni]